MIDASANDNRTVWRELEQDGLVTGEFPQDSIGSPWYVKILLGFSGWLAAVFLMGFFALGLEKLLESEAASLVLGGMLLVGAFFMLGLRSKNEFVGQLALAMSLAGQGLVIWALARLIGENEAGTWLAVGVFQGVLAFLMPDFIHRVFSAFVMGACITVYLIMQRWLFLPSGLWMLVVSALWLQELRFPLQLQRTVPIAYGLTLVLVCLKGALAVQGEWVYLLQRETGMELWMQPWMGESVIALVTLSVVWMLLRRSGLQPVTLPFMAALAAAVVICLLSYRAQGITVGMTLLLLGFAGSNRVLTGLGVAALLFFVSSYYYFLGVTLLDKAGILLGVGLALWIVAWAKRYWLTPVKTGAQHE